MAAMAASSVASSFLQGSTTLQVERGCARVSCRKEGIHPKFHSQAEVFCNGELVMTTGGTQPKYVVDVWSGNHPFYQGKETAFLQDADRVDRFNRRFGGESVLSDVPVLTTGDIVIEKKRKIPKGGKGGIPFQDLAEVVVALLFVVVVVAEVANSSRL
ncbi:hypothetical protein GOP47_0015448 [Adiantum capillus-veneris]|uniref:Large ribosomal subunit protein bL31c n=1 Tax=Adiantum capillus-veneris TaxID=13818 RepID=A0A9D4UKG4_ADICA|nr:hypothetical protein GOP47_0015448 [Adiantum capillus-veneris]